MNELDQLLADLGAARTKTGNQKPASPVKNSTAQPTDQSTEGTNADGSDEHLDADFAPLGAVPCVKCKELIIGPSITTTAGVLHPDCFRCADESCRRRLVGQRYYPVDTTSSNLPEPSFYCEPCFAQHSLPLCHYCQSPISSTYITALGYTLHSDHFFCSHCGTPLKIEEPFMEYDRKPYCEPCYRDMFAEKCAACGNPIVGECIEACEKRWCRGCFKCEVCKEPLTHSYFTHDSKPYCEKHYYTTIKDNIIPCRGCSKPITGKFTLNAGHRWHPECFKCGFCRTELRAPVTEQGWIRTGVGMSAGSAGFKNKDDIPYCDACYVKLYA
ncbi:hypothetical protein BC832DRAFT_547164 [Gaertneriomyces semiglobifer]|nr:hypothetical protein BC832DRAFT_547164 [Gaertneriomyces semiglobifer]